MLTARLGGTQGRRRQITTKMRLYKRTSGCYSGMFFGDMFAVKRQFGTAAKWEAQWKEGERWTQGYMSRQDAVDSCCDRIWQAEQALRARQVS